MVFIIIPNLCGWFYVYRGFVLIDNTNTLCSKSDKTIIAHVIFDDRRLIA
jgi:hypothetical protein